MQFTLITVFFVEENSVQTMSLARTESIVKSPLYLLAICASHPDVGVQKVLLAP